MTANPRRMHGFIQALTRLIDAHADAARILAEGTPLLRALVSVDDWLPNDVAVPGADTYRQYLLYRDPGARFSIVSFVWGPGQSTPVHDHTVWGMVGMLRGEEISTPYTWTAAAPRRLVAGPEDRLRPGEAIGFAPAGGDIHCVRNALADRASISIHVYGGDIGAIRRHVYEPETGEVRDFISGYSPAPVPRWT